MRRDEPIHTTNAEARYLTNIVAGKTGHDEYTRLQAESLLMRRPDIGQKLWEFKPWEISDAT